jgi:hypothetical protein
MEVCVAGCVLGWVERMKVKCSKATRDADATRPFALLLYRNRAAHGVGEPRAELCSNPSALGAEESGRSSAIVRQTRQTFLLTVLRVRKLRLAVGTWVLLSTGWRKYRQRHNAEETQSTIWMPSGSDQRNQAGYRRNADAGRQAGAAKGSTRRSWQLFFPESVGFVTIECRRCGERERQRMMRPRRH